MLSNGWGATSMLPPSCIIIEVCFQRVVRNLKCLGVSFCIVCLFKFSPKFARHISEGVLFLRKFIEAKVLSGSNQEGSSVIALAIAGVIAGAHAGLGSACAHAGLVSDGESLMTGTTNLAVTPRASLIACTIVLFGGDRLLFHQEICAYSACRVHWAPDSSIA